MRCSRWSQFLSVLLTGALALAGFSAPAVAAGGNGICTLSSFGDDGDSSTIHGSASDPFRVSNQDSLAEIRDCLSAISSTSHFLQTADITLTGDWTSIGDSGAFSNPSSNQFKGRYDGGGFSINGLSQANGSGLFANVIGGEIKNLSIEGTVTSSAKGAGLLAGYAANSTFSNLVAFGQVTGGGTDSIVGGLIGNSNNTARVSISSFSVAVDVTGTSTIGILGGAIGRVSGPILIQDFVVESKTRSGITRGSLVSSRLESSANDSPKAISTAIGWLQGSSAASRAVVQDCRVSINADFKDSYFGGVAGYVSSADINRCNVPGSFVQTGKLSSKNGLGGIAGYVNDVGISNSVFSGKVLGYVAPTSPTTTNSSTSVGGIVGFNFGSVRIARTASIGEVSGFRSVGGYIGDITGGITSWIKESYFAGSVSAVSTSVGGIFGSTVTAYHDFLIENTYATGTVSGDSSIGGFAGSATNTMDIVNSFALVGVTSTSTPKGGFLASKGSNASYFPTVTQSFWNQERAGVTANAAATEIDESDFSNLEFFQDAGWDISQGGVNTIWKMGSCAPILSWQQSEPANLCPKPAPVSATLNAAGNEITVVFSKDVNFASGNDLLLPDQSVFSVSVSGGVAALSTSGVISRGLDNRTVTFGLNRKVASGEEVRLSYLPPVAAGSSPQVFEDATTGEDASPFTNFPVTNNSTLGPRLELLSGGFIVSYSNLGDKTEVQFEVNECPSASFDPSEVFEIKVDGQTAPIASETFSSADCSFFPFTGFTVDVDQKIFRDQTVAIFYRGDSLGINGPDSLVSSNGLTFKVGTPFEVTSKAFAVWRPVLSASSLVSASSAIQFQFETYGEGLAFSKTAGTTTFGNPHPLFDHLTITGASSSGVPTISGSTLTIPLGNTIYQGNSLTVSYVDPNASTNDNLDGLLEMADGPQTSLLEDAKPFSVTINTSNAPSQPEISSATVDAGGRALSLVFSEDLAAVLPSGSVLSLSVDGNPVTVSSMVRSVALNSLIVSLQSEVVMPGSVVTVSYTDPTVALEDPASAAIGSASGDWDAKSFSVTAVNSSNRAIPVADATTTETQNSITATATCQSGCSGAAPDSSTFRLLLSGSQVASNTNGQFTGLTAGTDYVLEVAISYNGLTSASISKNVTTQVQTLAPAPGPAPAPSPAPAPTQAPEPTPVATPSPAVTTSPQPTPSPTPTPSATPTPEPAVTPVAVPQPTATPAGSPQPTAEPTTGATQDPEPTPEPTEDTEVDGEPTPEPSATSTAEENPPTLAASPGTLVVEDISSGTIILQQGQDVVVLTAALLEEVVFQLAPLDAPLDQGRLTIDTELRSLEILVVELGEVTFTASELGSFIEFTLVIPGFEPNSLRVLVDKEDLNQIGGLLLGGLVAAILAGALLVLFVLRRRKRENSNSKGSQVQGSARDG